MPQRNSGSLDLKQRTADIKQVTRARQAAEAADRKNEQADLHRIEREVDGENNVDKRRSTVEARIRADRERVPDKAKADEKEVKNNPEAQTDEPPKGEKRESAEVHQSRGFTTDAAWRLLTNGGYISPGQGIDKLENRLNISGKSEQMNYTAIGGTLYVEAVDANGTAQKFAVPMGGRIVDKLGSKDQDQENTEPQKGKEKINPIATYQTQKIGTIYSHSPDSSVGIADDSIRTGGKLPELLRDADKNNVVIERTWNGVESDIVAKKDGKVIARTAGDLNLNDRNQWENALAQMLDNALHKQNPDKT